MGTFFQRCVWSTCLIAGMFFVPGDLRGQESPLLITAPRLANSRFHVVGTTFYLKHNNVVVNEGGDIVEMEVGDDGEEATCDLVTEAFYFSNPAMIPAPQDTIVSPVIMGWPNIFPQAIDEKSIGSGNQWPFVYRKTFEDIGNTHVKPIAGTFGMINRDDVKFDMVFGVELSGRNAAPFRALDVPNNAIPAEPGARKMHRFYFSVGFSNPNAEPLRIILYQFTRDRGFFDDFFEERMAIALPAHAAGIFRCKGSTSDLSEYFGFLEYELTDAADGFYDGRMDVYINGEDEEPVEKLFRIPVPQIAGSNSGSQGTGNPAGGGN